MMATRHDVLIVGGGHAGAQVAIALRQQGFAGSIAIVGDEPDLPYDRPPLTKEYLNGSKSFETMLLRSANFWLEQNIALLLGHEVTAVDADIQLVTCSDGAQFRYGTLVWAAGGNARSLACPGHDLLGVHTIRSRADIDRMKVDLPAVKRVIVVGGGYIGLETSSVLIEMGKQVVLIEAQDRVLARVAGEMLSLFYEAEHRARGLDLRLSAVVESIVDEEGKAAGIRLANGDIIEGDMIVAGIGIVPAVAPLARAGAEIGNGVVVDSNCRTSLPEVYAIGDCAEHPNPFAAQTRIRLESVQNANDQAKAVAQSIAGQPSAYDAAPWFWSNQFDLRLQTVGLSAGHDMSVLRGDPATRSFSLVYLRKGRVIALDCVNATKDFVQGKALVLNKTAPDLDRLADASTPLRDLARPRELEQAGGQPDHST
jgi:3-phenylpropionate/trans-cinnamate dioxygenase ferredoxin reductase subunit